ncbi:hypothetical protein BC936DRAFT_140701 [Jimgerdemannia flammicorona]|uniref:Uncharacterized protein n=1 Tax=Jimgerdemannia flammicorona TaxID=994334 RepID=A0A433ADN9_9FUNG|nr:hypothetical protein BC936DRAFT_140701 [Jimgerdemannia flammicorona]
MEKMQWALKVTATPFATPPSMSTALATTKPTTQPINASSEQPALGPIIGGVLGGIVVCALAGLAAVLFLRRRRNCESGQRLAIDNSSSDTEADDKYPQSDSLPPYSGPLPHPTLTGS